MIFLQLWWTLMVLSGSNTLNPKGEKQLGSDKLRSFHNDVNEAREQLHELHSDYGSVQDSQLYRHRRNSIDELLSSFAQSDDKQPVADMDDKELQEAADSWFRDFQAGLKAQPLATQDTAKHSRAAGRAHSKIYPNDYSKMLEQTEIGKVKKKYKEYNMDSMPPLVSTTEQKQPEEPLSAGATQLDIKLKHVQQLLANQEQEQQIRDYNRAHKEGKHFREKENKLPEFGDSSVPDGIYEQTLARLQIAHMNPNNLSHEANYKLSKIEQEAAERAGKVRYPIGLQKRSSSFNPMNEIKLKTSNRLMRKGMGPSLPSNALTDNMRAHYVDNLLLRRERNMKRERARVRERHQLHEEGVEAEKDHMIVPNEGLNLLESPQSYDYRLPQFDQLHTLNQRTLPNVRYYVQSNLRMNQKGERFKRQHEQPKQQKLKETAAKLEQHQVSEAKREAKKQPTAKLEQSVAKKTKEDKEKAAVAPTDAKLQGEALVKTKSESQAKVEKPQQQAQDSEPVKLETVKAQVKDTEKEQELKTDSKLASEAAKPIGSQAHTDAFIKLLANKIAQHSNNERDKRNIKRWTWHRFHRQKGSHGGQSLETSHQKHRSRRSVEQLAEPQTEECSKAASKLLDDFEDHNGNHLQLGSGLLTLDTNEAEDVDALQSSLKDEPVGSGLLESNTFANSRYQVPMLGQRNNNLAYPQQQQQQQPQQQLQQQPLCPQQCQPQPMMSKPLQLPLQHCQQLQQQQQLQQANNARANFNLTHFFNELAKLQKLPAAQLQQLQQQPQQVQQQQQQPLSLDINQCKNLCGANRFSAPFMNKQVTIDPCTTTTQSINQSTTMHPDCVLITAAAVDPTTTTTTTAATAATVTTQQNTATTPAATTTTTATVAVGDNTCSNGDAVKLKISMNGNLCSNPKTKQLFGNGSINVQPTSQRMNAEAYYELVDALVDEADADMDSDHRYTRMANRSVNREKQVDRDEESEQETDRETESDKEREREREREKEKEKQKHEKTTEKPRHRHKFRKKHKPKEQQKEGKEAKEQKEDKKQHKTDKNKNQSKKTEKTHKSTVSSSDIDRSEPISDNFDKLMTGTASKEIVRAVFDMVSNDPTLDPLSSVLARNRHAAHMQPKPFYQIRNDRNEEHLQQTEDMVRKTMESISDIIDTQMRQRSCIPLRPDLVEFYNVILKTMAEQQKTREKREAKLSLLSDDFNQNLHIVDANNIEQKSRIVKKLLRQYDELPIEEQRKATGVRDELLTDLIYLRKMADSLERSQRNAQLQGVLKKSSSADETAEQQMFSEYSPRFIKLLKTAEVFKEVGEQQAKEFIGI